MSDIKGNTILTGTAPELTKEQKESSRHVDRIKLLCNLMIESLKDGSIEYSRTLNYIADIIKHSVNNEFLTARHGERLAGYYFLEASSFHKVKKGLKPSALVKFLKDGHILLTRRDGRVTTFESKKTNVYQVQSKSLRFYGLDISERQIKRWVYNEE